MQAILEHALRSRHPHLYGRRSGRETTTFDEWGFQHGDGWYALLDALSVIVTQRAHASALDIRILQVKQKLGTLRFYAHGLDEFCNGAVALAYLMSARLCERTGRPGLLSDSNGSVQTLAPGLDPAFRPQAGADVTRRWIACCDPTDAIVLVQAAWPMTLIDVQPGHADLADALLGFLTNSESTVHQPNCVVSEIHADLVVSLNAESAAMTDTQLGAVAVARSLAGAWIDPVSGVCRPADAGGRPSIRPLLTDPLEPALKKAHDRSFRNHKAIAAGGPCGCFYCVSTFHASEVGEWVDGGRTALCPHCHIGAVLSGILDPIDPAFLRAMNARWFGQTTGLDLSTELAQLSKLPGPEI
jgi:hypothetical protein